MRIYTHLKALAGKIRTNFIEWNTLLAIVVGLPAIAYLYVDVKLAAAVFIMVQIALGVVALRKSE